MTAEVAGVVDEPAQDEGPELSAGHVLDVGHAVTERTDGGLLELPGGLTRSFTTPRAVVVMRREHFPAVATGRTLLRRALAVVLDDTSVPEDGVVVLLPGDVLVGRPHVGVDRPVDAVFDLRPVVALATHSRDSGVSEVVRIDGLLDVGLVGSSSNLRPDRLRREGTEVALVIGPGVAVARHLVEERDVVAVRPRVRVVEIASERSPGVDDGIRHDLRTLQTRRVRVGREGGLLSHEFDVSDAERPDQGETSTSISEELDERHVAHVVRAVGEGLDVPRPEHVIGGHLVGLGSREIVVFGPFRSVDVDHPQELPDGELDVPDGVVGHPRLVSLTVRLAVSEVVEMDVEILFGQRRDRLVDPLGSLSEVREISDECAFGDVAVDLGNEPFHVAPVGLVIDIETVEFELEAAAESLEILQVTHCNTYLLAGYYESGSRKNRLFARLSSARTSLERVLEGRKNDLSQSTDGEPVNLPGFTPGLEPAKAASNGKDLATYGLPTGCHSPGDIASETGGVPA